jgi:hypothetical protein
LRGYFFYQLLRLSPLECYRNATGFENTFLILECYRNVTLVQVRFLSAEHCPSDWELSSLLSL